MRHMIRPYVKPYPKEFVQDVINQHPTARITSIGPNVVSMSVQTGPDSQKVVGRYMVATGQYYVFEHGWKGEVNV